jgi:hypothetical protein
MGNYQPVPLRDTDPGPDSICSVEAWFKEVALQDAKKAIEGGLSRAENFPGRFGDAYKHLQT